MPSIKGLVLWAGLTVAVLVLLTKMGLAVWPI
jgi:hypothetical protein